MATGHVGCFRRIVLERGESMEHVEQALRDGEDRLRRMHLVTSALAEALTPADVARVLVQQGVAAARASTASVFMFDATRTTLSLLAITGPGATDALAAKWQSIPAALDTPLAYSARQGVPLFLASRAEWVAWTARFPGGPAPSADSVGWATIPLNVKGRPIGVVGFAFTSPPSFRPNDIELLTGIAAQCAQAFDRARLYDVAQRSAERGALLAEVSAHVAESLDWATIQKVVDLAVPRLADYCMLATYEHGAFRPVSVAPRPGTSPGADLFATVANLWRFTPEDPTSPTTRMWSTGQSVRISNYSVERDGSKDQTPEFVASLQALGPRSLLLAPVAFRGALFGLFAFINTERNFDADDQLIADELARRAGVALENARLYEEAVSEREAAERAKSMRDEVLAIVAHDLGSPLNAVGLWADVVFRAAPHGPSGESTRGSATKIKDAVRRMNELLRDLLDAASIDAGHLAIAPGEASATDLVLDAISEFAPLAAEKGIGLAVAASSAASSADVTCDTRRIHQVLSNLLGNAIKFTPRGGRITVGIKPSAYDVELSVADTGPGIAPDAAAKIFDRFWRGSQRDLAKGVGLGLFIAKGIVEAHGGRLWLASTAGGGATFCFTVPLARSAPRRGTTSARPPHEPAGSRTEDEP